MKRYNRGFLNWGPMEHHKEGDWVNFNEAHTFYGNIIEQMSNSVKQLASNVVEFATENRLLEEENARLVSRNNWLTFVATVAIFSNVVLVFTK